MPGLCSLIKFGSGLKLKLWLKPQHNPVGNIACFDGCLLWLTQFSSSATNDIYKHSFLSFSALNIWNFDQREATRRQSTGKYFCYLLRSVWTLAARNIIVYRNWISWSTNGDDANVVLSDDVARIRVRKLDQKSDNVNNITLTLICREC